MVIQIATTTGVNRGHHAGQSSDSLRVRITAIFRSVLQKLQPARRCDLVLIEKAAEPVEVFCLMRLASVKAEQFMVTDHLIKQAHWSTSPFPREPLRLVRRSVSMEDSPVFRKSCALFGTGSLRACALEQAPLVSDE